MATREKQAQLALSYRVPVLVKIATSFYLSHIERQEPIAILKVVENHFGVLFNRHQLSPAKNAHSKFINITWTRNVFNTNHNIFFSWSSNGRTLALAHIEKAL